MKRYAYINLLGYSRVQLQALQKICKSLFENLGFSSLSCTKTSTMVGRLVLENKEWLKIYGEFNFQERNYKLNSFLYNVSQVLKSHFSKQYHAEVLLGIPNNRLYEYLASADLWDCLIIYIPVYRYIEVYYFVVSRDNGNILSFNERYFLGRFIRYFREKLEERKASKILYVIVQIFTEIFIQFKKNSVIKKEDLVNIGHQNSLSNYKVGGE